MSAAIAPEAILYGQIDRAFAQMEILMLTKAESEEIILAALTLEEVGAELESDGDHRSARDCQEISIRWKRQAACADPERSSEIGKALLDGADFYEDCLEAEYADAAETIRAIGRRLSGLS